MAGGMATLPQTSCVFFAPAHHTRFARARVNALRVDVSRRYGNFDGRDAADIRVGNGVPTPSSRQALR
jgi:hypothetical protein